MGETTVCYAPMAMAHNKPLDSSFRSALVTVMGDDSKRSRQNAQHVVWAFDSLLLAFSEGGGRLSETVIRRIMPFEALRLAIDVDWIPYLNEHGDPHPEKIGQVNANGYWVTNDLFSAFLHLLPIDTYIEDAKTPWLHPTPADIVEEVLQERGWTRMQFIQVMQIENGAECVEETIFDGSEKTTMCIPMISPQDSNERYGLDRLLTPPLPNARRTKALAEYRSLLLRVIRKNSEKHATLEEHLLSWRPAKGS